MQKTIYFVLSLNLNEISPKKAEYLCKSYLHRSFKELLLTQNAQGGWNMDNSSLTIISLLDFLSFSTWYVPFSRLHCHVQNLLQERPMQSILIVFVNLWNRDTRLLRKTCSYINSISRCQGLPTSSNNIEDKLDNRFVGKDILVLWLIK